MCMWYSYATELNMKTRLIYIGLFIAICASVYFTYHRSFIADNFEVTNSDAEIIDGVPPTGGETEI